MTTSRINQVTTVTPSCLEGCKVRPQINRAEQFAERRVPRYASAGRRPGAEATTGTNASYPIASTEFPKRQSTTRESGARRLQGV
jgi:hypothetical protein